MGLENSATKNTFWFFAQPVLWRYPLIVFSSSTLMAVSQVCPNLWQNQDR